MDGHSMAVDEINAKGGVNVAMQTLLKATPSIPGAEPEFRYRCIDATEKLIERKPHAIALVISDPNFACVMTSCQV